VKSPALPLCLGTLILLGGALHAGQTTFLLHNESSVPWSLYCMDRAQDRRVSVAGLTESGWSTAQASGARLGVLKASAALELRLTTPEGALLLLRRSDLPGRVLRLELPAPKDLTWLRL
jgi:hypothetical protein